MKISKDNHSEVYADLKGFYEKEIIKAAEKFGGKIPLSRLIGRDRTYISVNLERKDIDRLKEIYEKILIMDEKE